MLVITIAWCVRCYFGMTLKTKSKWNARDVYISHDGKKYQLIRSKAGSWCCVRILNIWNACNNIYIIRTLTKDVNCVNSYKHIEFGNIFVVSLIDLNRMNHTEFAFFSLVSGKRNESNLGEYLIRHKTLSWLMSSGKPSIYNYILFDFVALMNHIEWLGRERCWWFKLKFKNIHRHRRSILYWHHFFYLLKFKSILDGEWNHFINIWSFPRAIQLQCLQQYANAINLCT